MNQYESTKDRPARRPKTFLSAQEKYEIYLKLVRGELTTVRAANGAGVDRSTVQRIQHVAKEGALAALADCRPGAKPGIRESELDAAKAEVERLSETVKDLRVKLMLLEGKGGWG